MKEEIDIIATPEKFERLGREIKISPKSVINVNAPGLKIQFYCKTAEILISIGKEHTARLIMDEDALRALRAGEGIDITTAKEFRNSIK